MKQISANITGSFILNGTDLTNTLGSSSIWSGSFSTRVSDLESFSSSLDATYATDVQLNAVTQSVNTLSSSFLSYTSSTDDKIAQLYSSTASINNATASLYTATASLNAATASLYTATASLNNYTSSNTMNIANLFATSASLNAAVADIRNTTASLFAATASIYNATSSLNAYTASTTLRINALDQYTASLNTRSASFACVTATNNFACTQYFSNTSNAVGFSSTGSLYSDGGMRITKDMYVSGTAFFNNVTVFGTQSVAYISSSQLNIGTNIISVNTDTPSVRFGGLAVYDSGSTGLTGSILWDSQDNQWIYSNPSGSEYDSAVFLVGPRNSGVLGNEPGISCNFLSKGNGMHHMTSSGIFEDGSRTCFYGSGFITSTGVSCFTTSCAASIIGGTVCGTSATFSSAANSAPVTLITLNNTGTTSGGPGIASRVAFTAGVTSLGYIQGANHSSGIVGLQFSGDGSTNHVTLNACGNIGIGTTTPVTRLDVIGNQRLFPSSGDVNLSLRGFASQYINFTEAGVADRGLIGFAVGSGDFVYRSGGYDMTTGTERLRITSAGSVGIGTTSPAADLQINKNCDVVVAISSCVGVISGNRGALAFYNCATSTVAVIRAGAVTDNVGTELQFHTRPAGGSLTQAMTLNASGNLSLGIADATGNANRILHINGADSAEIHLTRSNSGTSSTFGGYLSFDGSNNFNLQNRTGGAVNLITGTTTALAIASTGAATFSSSVGINGAGTLFPLSVKVATNQNVRISSETSTSIQAVNDAANAYVVLKVDGSCLLLNTQSGGNVGIGTQSPSAKLTLEGSANNVNSEVRIIATGVASGYLGSNSNGFNIGTDTGGIVFKTDVIGGSSVGNTGTERMRIVSGGCIGINNCSPGSLLDIQNNINSPYDASNTLISNQWFRTSNTSVCTGATSGILFQAQGPGGGNGLATINGVTTSCGSMAITFGTRDASGAVTERMRITSSGRIGLGITSPCSRIETTGGGFILRGGWGLFCTAYTDDGLFSGCAMPNLLSTNAYGGVNTKFGSDSGLLLGYQDNGAGLYSPAYGFEVRSTDGNNTPNRVVRALVMRDTDTGAYPFWINNNGSAYFANCIGIGTSSPNSASPLHIRMCSNSNGDGIRIQAVCSGASGSQPGIAFANVSDSKRWAISLDNTSDIIQITNATGANALQINQSGIACFACTICSGGSIARRGFDYHTVGKWYKIPFHINKNNATGNADTQCLIVINNNDEFQQLHFTIEYGSRLQAISDSVTQTSLRTYGVNRFIGATATVNDVYLITGGSGCAINTHAPMSVAIVGSCMTVVKVDFSSSLGGSSFVWGEVRIWSIEQLAGKITVANNLY